MQVRIFAIIIGRNWCPMPRYWRMRYKSMLISNCLHKYCWLLYMWVRKRLVFEGSKPYIGEIEWFWHLGCLQFTQLGYNIDYIILYIIFKFSYYDLTPCAGVKADTAAKSKSCRWFDINTKSIPINISRWAKLVKTNPEYWFWSIRSCSNLTNQLLPLNWTWIIAFEMACW